MLANSHDDNNIDIDNDDITDANDHGNDDHASDDVVGPTWGVRSLADELASAPWDTFVHLSTCGIVPVKIVVRTKDREEKAGLKSAKGSKGSN